MTTMPMSDPTRLFDPFKRLGKNPLDAMLESLKARQSEDDEGYVDDNTIVVDAPMSQERAGPPPSFDLPAREGGEGRYVLGDNRIPPHADDTKEIVERKGMFGIKGTLRDILGTIGDAFLVQGGGKAVYQPRREQEKQGDAMLGFSENPMQAIERLAALGYTEQAAELYERAKIDELRKAQLESMEANRQSLIGDRQFENEEKGLDRISRWTRAGMPYERILAGALRYGIDEDMLAEMGITPEMTEDDRRYFSYGDMTVNQQEGWPRKDRSLDQRDRALDFDEVEERGRMARDNPPSAARPRADTELEYYRQVSNIPANKRTPEQKAFMKKYISGTRGSGRSAPPPPPANGSSPSRFRRLN